MRVCFVSLAAYPTLANTGAEHAGGAEFQQVNLARWLRDRGHEVSFVVGDYGQAETVELDGMRLHRTFALGAGNRKLRFLPDMIALRGAIHRSNAEIVNQRSTVFYTAQCCAFAHGSGAAFVFSVGSDYNCESDLRGRASAPIRKMYLWGLRNADAVLAQTERQKSMLAQNFGIGSRLTPNILEIPELRNRDEDQGYLLWIGSLSRLKRPELYLELARALPDLRFLLVGGPGEDAGFDAEVHSIAEGIPNLEWLGFVPPSQTDALYRGARLLIGTSEFEGLPNTYLQAWAHGVPVISIDVDPDDVISRLELGERTGSAERLATTVREWFSDSDRCREAGVRAHDHVKLNHDVNVAAESIERIFQEAIDRRA